MHQTSGGFHYFFTWVRGFDSARERLHNASPHNQALFHASFRVYPAVTGANLYSRNLRHLTQMIWVKLLKRVVRQAQRQAVSLHLDRASIGFFELWDVSRTTNASGQETWRE